MNVIIWARVSSREQREGYSIDAQLRANRERARSNGWNVVKEFVVAESAKRGAERLAFNEMYAWVRSNAKREKIKAILSHKLDRVCRNMRDAVRLQELEDTCGVQLAFVDNQFGPGAAGALSFNVMAAVAQYYSDNLRSEVLKGLDEKVRQGWPTGSPPYGYMIVKDPNEPIQPHAETSLTVKRIFELYRTGSYTFEKLAELLLCEGHVFRKSCPRFGRSALSYILNNRFYIGELRRNGQTYEGRYRQLIDRATFDDCQAILNGKNRRTGTPEHPLAGGLFQCAYCGQSITGERIRRKLRGGGVREHLYYRCANNHPGPNHPTVRWKSEKLEEAIVHDLATLQLPSPDIAAWFRRAIEAAANDLTANKRRLSTNLTKRKTELATMQDRLLNAYLGGTVNEDVFKQKTADLNHESAKLQESLDQLGMADSRSGDTALTIFDWSQRAADLWHGSNNSIRRDILDSVCLNRTLSDVTLVTQKRKPFDIIAERLKTHESRGDRI